MSIKVGAAKRVITPELSLLPMGAMVGQYEGVRDGEDIHVRAIVLDNGERTFLFESYELGGVPCDVELRKRIEDKYGISQENMLLVGTHNHSAPHPMGYGSSGPFGPHTNIPENVLKWTDFVLEQGVGVIGDAMANMKPATWGFGEGKSYINVNRDKYFHEGYWMQGNNWEGYSDKTLAALKFVGEDGKLIAAVLNYAMHSTTSFCIEDTDGKVKVTCDAPGIACNYAEEYFGNDAVVLWQSGAAGNQNPLYVGIMQLYDKSGTMRQRRRMNGAPYEMGVSLGMEHGMDAVETLEKICADRTEMPITTVDDTIWFPKQKFPEGIDRGYHRLVVDNLLEWSGHVTPEEPFPPKVLAEMEPTDEKVPMKAQLILMGDVAFYGIACELYNEISKVCKDASPFKHLMITTHVGTPSAGYILDNGSVGHKVFQSFGLVGAGGNDEIVRDGMLKMFEKALNEK
ncbi:MAG: hypothetical protein IKE36_03765 [Solobacterium sp.]|nr:hypothetical protein [Solobacterium sp.]